MVLYEWQNHAGVAELADARDLKSRDESRTGSIPVTGTTSEGANTVPFPPCGENCTMLAPSSFPNRTHFAGLRFGSPREQTPFRFRLAAKTALCYGRTLLFVEYFSSVFRRKHYVIFAIPLRMR